MAKRRAKKPLKRQFSAGGVVYRDGNRVTEWLLIKPAGGGIRAKGREAWRLPKGLIDPGETSLIAAQREVEEEGGVETEVVGKVGQDKYFYILGKDRIYKIVTYYLMHYLQEVKGPISWETEEIAWLPFKEAYERLAFKGEREILQKAQEMVKSSPFDKLKASK